MALSCSNGTHGKYPQISALSLILSITFGKVTKSVLLHLLTKVEADFQSGNGKPVVEGDLRLKKSLSCSLPSWNNSCTRHQNNWRLGEAEEVRKGSNYTL